MGISWSKNRSQVYVYHKTDFINSTNIHYVAIMFQSSTVCVEDKTGIKTQLELAL